jgi:hypothetical protein
MKTKQPLYTALGWVTWTLGKRAVKRKLAGDRPRRMRKVVLALVMLGGAGAGAYAVTSGSTGEA